MSNAKSVYLFDLDGTLTEPRKMLEFLYKLKSFVSIAIVTGSDYLKILEQIPETDVVKLFCLVFSENGLVVHKEGQIISQNSIATKLGEEYSQRLINTVLRIFSEIKLPKKRGLFIEYRNGLINISPIGRTCTQEERDEFYLYDKEHKIRDKIVQQLETEFGEELVFSIGGQISIDIYPKGWDKSYCLGFIKENFSDIHFFGDKTEPGGNDFEIFSEKRINGHTVSGPDDTISQISKLLQI